MNDEIERLLSAIRSGSRDEVWEAAKRLESLVLDLDLSLMRILEDGGSPDARAAAAYVLGHSRFASARTGLEGVVADPDEDPTVRGQAAEALAYIRSRESVEVLVRHLRDRSPEVRYWCMFALGQIGDPKALPALRDAAERAGSENCDGRSLRSEALEAISEIEGGSHGLGGART